MEAEYGNDLSLVILAAGMGSRYGGIKQVEPVGPNGEFILHYSIYDALKAGFQRIYLVIRHDILEQFRQGIGILVEKHSEANYIFQDIHDLPVGFNQPFKREKLWGTGHALWSCRSYVNTPFAVINADDYYGQESFARMAQFLLQKRSGVELGLIGYPIANTLSEHGTVSRAICQANSSGFLSEIQERTRIKKTARGSAYLDENGDWIDIPGSAVVSMNFWGFLPEIFPDLETTFHVFLTSPDTNLATSEFYIPSFVDSVIHRNRARVKIIPTNSSWCGITYPQDKSWVQETIALFHKQGVYPNKLWERMD
jgi:NDP-sugar pyrophosphorylase family protein